MEIKKIWAMQGSKMGFPFHLLETDAWGERITILGKSHLRKEGDKQMGDYDY